jgi:uncharacterized protein (UPF0276 family)
MSNEEIMLNEEISLERGRALPARSGVGLRAQHHDIVIRERPDVGWFEAHTENYFADGGAAVASLMSIRELYPVTLHGVGLSIGSMDPLDPEHLARTKRAVQRFEPVLVSEHLSWSSVNGRYANDLLPLPYTHEARRHVVSRINQVQDYLERQILIENVSSYLEFDCSDMSESTFLQEVASAAGCGILLDVNNIYVAARNHGQDPHAYLESIPPLLVQELHLAGHQEITLQGRPVLIDTHGARVCEPVWQLYRHALQRFGRVPTLIEWDTDIPAVEVLQQEAARADAMSEGRHAVAA